MKVPLLLSVRCMFKSGLLVTVNLLKSRLTKKTSDSYQGQIKNRLSSGFLLFAES